MPDPILTSTANGSTQTTPTQSAPPQANTPEARTPAGTLIDQRLGIPPTTDGQPTSSATETSEAGAEGTELEPGAVTKLPTAPESYTDFAVPTGFKLSPETLAEVTPIFKDLNLTQDQAQKLVDAHTAMVKADAKAYSDTRAGWLRELAADKDIGHKLSEVKIDIGRALDHLNDPALDAAAREALAFTGAGDHPAIIKMIYKLAALVNEGRPVTGAGPSPLGQTANGQAPSRSAAARMYPNLPS